MATAAQVVASLAEAQALQVAGSVTDAQMLSLARLAMADLMVGRTASYSVSGRSVGFASLDSAQKAVEYFQQRVDGGSNAMAVNLAEL